jgi:hypothetical protein
MVAMSCSSLQPFLSQYFDDGAGVKSQWRCVQAEFKTFKSFKPLTRIRSGTDECPQAQGVRWRSEGTPSARERHPASLFERFERFEPLELS